MEIRKGVDAVYRAEAGGFKQMLRDGPYAFMMSLTIMLYKTTQTSPKMWGMFKNGALTPIKHLTYPTKSETTPSSP